MRINTNIASMNAQANNAQVNKNLNDSLEKLSSGLRINKAADDASGMAIADKLRTQASTLGQGIANANSGTALIQIADKAMSEQSNILDIVKTKLLQASTSTTSVDGREAIRKDITKLLDQLNAISEQTTYNGINLLNNKGTDFTFQVGEKSTDIVGMTTAYAVNTDGLGTIKEEVAKDSGTIQMTGLLGTTSGSIDGEQLYGFVGSAAITMAKDELGTVSVRSTAAGTGTEGVGAVAINSTIVNTAAAVNTSFSIEANKVSAIHLTGLNGTVGGALSVDMETTDEDLKLLLDAMIASHDGLSKVGDGRYTLTAADTASGLLNEIVFSTETDISNLKFSNVATGLIDTAGAIGTSIHEMITIISADEVSVTKLDKNDYLSITSADTAQGAAMVASTSFVAAGTVTANADASFDNVKFSSTLTLTSGSATVQVEPDLHQEESYVVIESEQVAASEAGNASYTIDAKEVTSITLETTGAVGEVGIETDDEDTQSRLEFLSVTTDSLVLNDDGTFTITATASGADAVINFGEEPLDISNLKITGIEANNTPGLREVLLVETEEAVTVTNHTPEIALELSSRDSAGTDGTNLIGAVQDLTIEQTENLEAIRGLDEFELTKELALEFFDIVDDAITQLNTTRSDFGSTQNQLESAIRNMMVTQVNIKAAESVIRDVDYAAESANFNKQNIISQAGTYAMSQANNVQQNVMKLLQ